MCRVISVTMPSSSSGIESASATSATRSRNAASEPGSGSPVASSGRHLQARRRHRLLDGQVRHRRVARELAGDGDQLGEVLDPRRVLRVVARLQLGGVAGARVDRLQELGGALPLLDQLRQAVEHRHEAGDARWDRVASAPTIGLLGGDAQRGGERDPLAVGVLRDELLGPVADAALGHVEDPPQAHGVVRVGQHPQVGQGVADLPALVEAHAADHPVRQPMRTNMSSNTRDWAFVR